VDRRPGLLDLVAGQESESARAVAGYRPTFRHRLDDLGTPAADLLRGLPGVARAEAGVKVERPGRRVLPLRDWHFLPKELGRARGLGNETGPRPVWPGPALRRRAQ
jgi:hypothetical protein